MQNLEINGKEATVVKNKTGRYSLNEVIYGVVFTYKERSSPCTFPPFLYDNTIPDKIHFKKLTVEEHHKVPSEYDEDKRKTCDGYVLKDEKGQIFYNQYPEAHYGQTSDECDRLFEIYAETDEEINKIAADILNNPYIYKDAKSIFSSMMRGINDLSAIDTPEAQEKVKLLRNFIARFTEEFNNYTGKYIHSHKHPRFNYWIVEFKDIS